jgi:hypothetical protein
MSTGLGRADEFFARSEAFIEQGKLDLAIVCLLKAHYFMLGELVNTTGR